MKLVRAEEVGQLAAAAPTGTTGLEVNWLEGPANAARLDVGMVTLEPGAVAPAHVHIGGQVIMVVSGSGFVEAAGQRVAVGPGDVVITPPGELHTHGATSAGPMAHLTVTTGGYDFPSEAGLPG